MITTRFLSNLTKIKYKKDNLINSRFRKLYKIDNYHNSINRHKITLKYYSTITDVGEDDL